MNKRTIGIFIFDEVEVLDFAGPFEVFITASRMHKRLFPDQGQLFEVVTIAEKHQPAFARGRLQVEPIASFGDHPPLDVLIVPGGVITAELKKETVLEWIKKCSQTADITASVCTGAFLLAKAGLLDGKQATTHWEDIPDLQAMFPQVEVLENTRWVDMGSVVTAAGISAGIDMSLHLVERLFSHQLAKKTAYQMEFDWHNTGITL